MKKILLLFVCVFLLLQGAASAKSKLIRTLANVNDMYGYNTMYGDDLAEVEEYIFGASFERDTILARLNRIERNLFSQCYPTLSLSQRMNNILANYRKNNDPRNYLSDYYGRNNSPVQRFKNYYFGQPTGFTPPVMNMPFNDYGRPYGINRGFYNNRGSYSYQNEYPTGAGFGVHILDD
jgi:hypothetical protein